MIINVAGVPAYVEVADDDYLRSLGLMHRESLPPNSGMLFTWPDMAHRSFWMKNTHIPLSIAYMDNRGKILNIEEMQPFSLKSVASTGEAMCALEMPQGWFEENGVMAGDVVTGLFESSLAIGGSIDFDLSASDFYYKSSADEVVDFIMNNLSTITTVAPDEFFSEFVWPYVISAATWAEYWQDEGSAYYSVEVDIVPTAFDTRHPGWNIDATAGFGSSNEALIEVSVQLDPTRLESIDMSRLERELYNVIPHEMHHLTQRGQPFERPNCPALPPAEGDSHYHYFTQACEIPSFLVGFRGESAVSGEKMQDLVDGYLQNYINVGAISPGEAEGVKDAWLGHDKWVDLVDEQLIQSIGQEALLEVTELPREYFSAIDTAVTSSKFWEQPNTQEDIDVIQNRGGNSLGTPAADSLTRALQDVFDELGLDIDVVISSHETDDYDGMTLHSGHPAYPNRWLVDARWYVSKQRPGRNTIDMEIMTAEEDIKSLDSAALVRHITQTVRHEIVHYEQMKKQAKNKGLDNAAAFEEMLQDPSQVPKSGKIKDYLRSHIEIDAHAHDGAEELLAVYGKQKAFEMLRKGFDLGDPKMPNAIQHYFEQLPESDPTLNKFRSKLFSQIKAQTRS